MDAQDKKTHIRYMHREVQKYHFCLWFKAIVDAKYTSRIIFETIITILNPYGLTVIMLTYNY
jgi:hypothetical protein